MEKVPRRDALSKTEFHRRLSAWFKDCDDAMIGPARLVDRRTFWIHVRDGSNIFGLHVDTGREAVEIYLQMVARHGDDLQWEVAESRKRKLTAVVYGPDKLYHTPFYLYLRL